MSRRLDARKFQTGGFHEAVHARMQIGRTSPPGMYSEAELLLDMRAAHKFAQTPADKQVLLTCGGIGTARTLVPAIETVISRGQVSRTSDGRLDLTDLGHRVLKLMPPALRSVVTTAKMESVFSMIESGALPAADAEKRLKAVVVQFFEMLRPVWESASGRAAVSASRK